MRAAAFGPLALAAVLAACGGGGQQPPPVPPDAIPAGRTLGTASIAGRAVYTGPVKPAAVINMSSDAVCHGRREGEPRREDLVVGPLGALRYVFIHVADGLAGRRFAPPAEPVALDQRGCTYRPHVVGLQVGQALELINSDATLHNVHIVSQANKPFNLGMPIEGQRLKRYFSMPEVMVKAKCDVHPWMAAWIGVVDHPFFAVTGEDGAFAIKGLPAGEYVIEAWQETLGTQRQTLRLSDGETREITFSYSG